MKKKKLMPIEDERWYTNKGSNCPKDCWCRRIVAIPEEGNKRVFISQGWITKKQAELIVKIHNEWLDNRNA